ncbi:MAG: type VII secretion integral membrane protein EccD [Mycobacterium kyogaense]|uniref:type VII secretion integral membrane protein EccD n=1 Tax=Mycobacterium kyogaense TaxID=2212479 RepID=UPI002FF5476D
MAVHLPRQQRSAEVVLPAGCPIAVLLPSLVEFALGDDTHEVEPIRWVLGPAVGMPFDPAKSLHDNGVRDGDLLLLTDEPMPPPRIRAGTPITAVITAGRESTARTDGWDVAVTVIVALALAAVLGWAGRATGHDAALWVSAAIAAGAAVAAVAGWVTPPLTDALGMGAVGHAAVTGALAAADLSGAAVAVFASGAAVAMAVCLSMSSSRTAVGVRPAMIACAAASGAATAAAVIGALSDLGVGAVGALATCIALAGLGAAAPLAAAISGIGPTRHMVGPHRAQAAHRLLTGMTAGWSATAVTGLALVAADAAESRLAATVFAGVVGGVLLLRHRVHCDPARRLILGGTGLAALAIALLVAVTARPLMAPWWCCGVAATGAAMIRLRGWHPNPLLHSALRATDYVAIAAVLPLGAWLVGVYDAARAVNLP